MLLPNTDQVLDRVRIRLVQLIASLPPSPDGYLIPLRHQIQEASMTEYQSQYPRLQHALIGHTMNMVIPMYHMVNMMPPHQIEQVETVQQVHQWQQQAQQCANCGHSGQQQPL
ncbi:hypothetical protein L5515_015154 [Caenorhabditis briggsae]|uniref:Uncharacterized protein n=1 Tax=Caenorhabditis briggsae TaxID=6238 RepID=A0AAE9EDD5_CAEBR|nr:hypothetical protein L5515_015154 [Caenorhabditis briggsae]